MDEPTLLNTDPANPADPAAPPADSAAPIKPADPAEAADPNKPTLTPEEQKAADEKAAEDKKKEEEGKKESAPEKYEDFKMPEGMEIDADLLKEFTPLAKEANLSQEMAQKFVDLQAKKVAQESARQWEVWEKTQETWVNESKNDKEIGGANFEANLGLAKKALNAYGSDALKDLADATGMGNHKEFIRFLAKVGKDIGEDKLRIGGGAPTKDGDRASKIYDSNAGK